MKKVIRIVWIGIVSGLAFLVACTCHKGLSRAEKKQLKTERAVLIERLNMQSSDVSEDPEIMHEVKQEEYQLRQRLYDIDSLLGNKESMIENSALLNKVSAEIDSLQDAINESRKPKPCVYGPPPTRYEPKLTPIQQLNQTRSDLLKQFNKIDKIVKEREGACVYGSPEVIQQYEQETQQLKDQALELLKQSQEIYEQIQELQKQQEH